MRPRPVYSLVPRAAFLATILVFLIPQAAIAHANRPQQDSSFSVPQWTSLRIRMDDTLTSRYSMEGDPFSATVVDEGPYQGARVYGTIQTIDKSGRFRGPHDDDSDVQSLDDAGRAARSYFSRDRQALITLRQGNSWTWRALSNQEGAESLLSFTPQSAPERARCLAESLAAAKVPESGRLSAGLAGLEPPRLPDRRRSESSPAWNC